MWCCIIVTREIIKRNNRLLMSVEVNPYRCFFFYSMINLHKMIQNPTRSDLKPERRASERAAEDHWQPFKSREKGTASLGCSLGGCLHVVDTFASSKDAHRQTQYVWETSGRHVENPFLPPLASSQRLLLVLYLSGFKLSPVNKMLGRSAVSSVVVRIKLEIHCGKQQIMQLSLPNEMHLWLLHRKMARIDPIFKTWIYWPSIHIQ